MRTVLVIGGGGFVGGAVMRALAATQDFTPIAGARRPIHGLAFRRCDATDPANLAAAAAGTSAIVNAAAGRPEAMRRATDAVCATAASGGQHIIHLSSMAVYGDAAGNVEESAPLDAAGSGYAAGKIACEHRLDQFMASGGVAAVLRPGIVYGPGDQQWTGRLCRLLRASRLGDLGAAGDGFCNLIHARDVGQAVLAVLRGRVEGAINLASQDPPRWNEVLTRLALAIGATPLRRIGARRLAVETGVLAMPLHAAKLAAARAGLRAGSLPEPIPPSLVALFAQPIRLAAGRADALGLVRTPEAAGLAEAAAWFLAQEGR